MTFSFRPCRPSVLPAIAASVSTLVVSWKDAAGVKDRVVQRRLGDAEKNRIAVGWLLALLDQVIVDVFELDPVDIVADDIGGVRQHR